MIKTAGVFALGAGLGPGAAMAGTHKPVNKLPKWKGFNLLDFFYPDPQGYRRTPEAYFSWMADWGFNFIRLPIAYPFYLDFDRTKPITPDDVYRIDRRQVQRIVDLVAAAHRHGIHVSLNLHRAPGYCINAGFHEPYNLWKDKEALDAFCYHWTYWAKLYKNQSRQLISFDLLNEPSLREDMNDQFSVRTKVPEELYRHIIVRAFKAIRAINEDHMVIADGNNVGADVIENVLDLDIGQSCRGYTPTIVSHYRAPWVYEDPGKLPEVKWPGIVDGQSLDRSLLERHFRPWIQLLEKGVGVHCGECGAWKETPHNVALAWMEDMFSILDTHGIGFSLWEFDGDFGILNSGRKDVAYEDWYGHQLDGKLLALLRKY